MGKGLLEVILIGDVEERIAHLTASISIRREHGALHVGQEGGRRGCSVSVVGGRTIVAQVACLVGKAGIEAYAKSLGELDVGVEADVQTAGTVVLQRTLIIDITQREVVVGHIVTTLHIDVIVLREGCAVNVVLPIGIVVILGIVIIRRILVEKLEVGDGGS